MKQRIQQGRPFSLVSILSYLVLYLTYSMGKYVDTILPDAPLIGITIKTFLDKTVSWAGTKLNIFYFT